MRAISIKCPECGAALSAPATAETTTCQYCGVTSQIQRRSRVLEVPLSTPKPPPGRPPMPIALQRRRLSWLLVLPVLGIIAAIAVPIVLAVRGDDGRSAIGVPESATRANSPSWGGRGVALVDVTGDGVLDPIGTLRITSNNDLFLAGFDGSDGKRLWISETLGKRGDLLGEPTAVVEGVAVIASKLGELIGIRIRDGSTAWRIKLAEEIDRLCAGPEGTVRVRTADERWQQVVLASGALEPDSGDDRCGPIINLAESPAAHANNESSEGRSLDKKIEGMDSRTSLSAGDAMLALGNKDPGSRIPMIARYRWPDDLPTETYSDLMARVRETTGAARRDLFRRAIELREQARNARPNVLWKTPVPAVDPMTVAEGPPEPEDVAVTARHVVIAYELRDHNLYRLTAFTLADGHRTWDISLPDDRPLFKVAASPTHAFVSRWDGLHAFDLATGKPAYTIH